MNNLSQVPDAWNPGLSSDIPERLLPLATLFRRENSDVSYKEAKEAAGFCGLAPKDLVALRVERLIVHEVLIRVTADLSVPDGPNYEELGINLRAMAARIIDAHVKTKLDSIRGSFETFRNKADGTINTILSRDVFDVEVGIQAEKCGIFQGLFKRSKPDATQAELPETRALAKWQDMARRSDDSFERACLTSLITIVGGILGQRGRLMVDQAVVAKLALNMFCNSFGSEYIGKLITPVIEEAVFIENYRFLPAQEKPFFMNVKGASAAGKSTIRPEQRLLAQKLNIPWEDFALISPDYWRKFLLDYDSLGADYKYVAMLTGQELEIIDKKLDRYMEAKAAQHMMPHLLIDRFRFDSFDVSKEHGKNSQLLTRFGDTVFLFFIVTPPAATVERAWKRGNETGRYKAVDDLLYHNIEAYSGMPNLFFSTVSSADKKIHFEFLDNSVPFGEKPRTIAYGWNDGMTILDLKCLNDIDRFQKVNVDAIRPKDVLEPFEPTFSFLKDCLCRIPNVTLANQETLEVYGRVHDGEWVCKNPNALKNQDPDSFEMKCLAALGWDEFQGRKRCDPPVLDAADAHDTLGDWGIKTGA